MPADTLPRASVRAEPMTDAVVSRPVVILRLPQVKARIGLSRSSIYAKLLPSSGQAYDSEFPRPVSLGSPMCHRRSAVGWLEHEIEAWVALRSAARLAG